MADKTFTDFTLKTPLSGDFLVGCNEEGTEEYRTTVTGLLSSYVTSNSTVAVGASAVSNIVMITQDAYDALPTKDPSTLFFIVG
jgi:hypothetical protein